MFKEYRSKELAEVASVGNLKLKVQGIGSNNATASKWLTITPSELEKIIAVLEPEDYKQAMDEMEMPESNRV